MPRVQDKHAGQIINLELKNTLSMDSVNNVLASRKSSGELRYYEQDGEMHEQEEQLGFCTSNTHLPEVENTPVFSATNAQFVSDIMQRTADVPLRPDVRNSRNMND